MAEARCTNLDSRRAVPNLRDILLWLVMTLVLGAVSPAAAGLLLMGYRNGLYPEPPP